MASDSGARVCTCGTGPNITRCPGKHLEHSSAKPGNSTKCQHLLTAEEAAARDVPAGTKCRRPAKVLKTLRTVPGQTAEDKARAELWPGEEPPAPWWEILAEPSGGPVCANEECGCDDPPIRCTPAHTAEICPSCGEAACWSISPETQRRVREHAEQLQQQAARAGGSASPAIPQRELDEQRRALRRRKRDLLGLVLEVLADKRITQDTRSDFEDFEEQLAAADTGTRLEQLEEQLAEYVIRRRSILQRSAELADYAEEEEILEGEVLEGEALSEDQDQDLAAAPASLVSSQPRLFRPLPRLALAGPAAPGYVPPDPDWRRKASPDERAYWDQIMGIPGRPAAEPRRRWGRRA